MRQGCGRTKTKTGEGGAWRVRPFLGWLHSPSRDRPSEKGGEAGGWREIGSISDSPNIYLTHF